MTGLPSTPPPIASTVGGLADFADLTSVLSSGPGSHAADRNDPRSATALPSALTHHPQWFVHVPELSAAFQVGIQPGDQARELWWGSQCVGRAVRDGDDPAHWRSEGRDHQPLHDHAVADGQPVRALFPTPLDALICARDAWRRRPAAIATVCGADYWTEPRPRADVTSLWLGRIHLGYHRPRPRAGHLAYTTDHALVADRDAVNAGAYPTPEAAQLAIRGAWRAHLHRVLRIAEPPPHQTLPA